MKGLQTIERVIKQYQFIRTALPGILKMVLMTPGKIERYPEPRHHSIVRQGQVGEDLALHPY